MQETWATLEGSRSGGHLQWGHGQQQIHLLPGFCPVVGTSALVGCMGGTRSGLPSSTLLLSTLAHLVCLDEPGMPAVRVELTSSKVLGLVASVKPRLGPGSRLSRSCTCSVWLLPPPALPSPRSGPGQEASPGCHLTLHRQGDATNTHRAPPKPPLSFGILLTTSGSHSQLIGLAKNSPPDWGVAAPLASGLTLCGT